MDPLASAVTGYREGAGRADYGGPDDWEYERRAMQQRRPEPDGDALLAGARTGNPYMALLWLTEHPPVNEGPE